jgi:hypothetical protein
VGFLDAIVIIVAIIAFANMRRHRTRHYAYPPEPLVRDDSAYTRELEREVGDLRKRLEVLERIVTDDRETKRLAHEIESLRDR